MVTPAVSSLRSDSSRRTSGPLLGVDVGGTKVRIALQSGAGEIVVEDTLSSRQFAHDFVAGMVRLVNEIVTGAGVSVADLIGVGIGMPGVVEPSGAVSQCPAFPNLTRTDVAGELQARLGVPISVANDADLSALAEFRYGSHEVRTLASVALGTGVGLGLVADGFVVGGDHGAAGEVSTYPIRVDGQIVELESIVSVAGLLRARGWTDPGRIPELVNAARAADVKATRVIDGYCSAVAELIAGISAILDPGLIVLTGGLGSQDVVADGVIAATRALGTRVDIEISQFRDRAPLLGAFALSS